MRFDRLRMTGFKSFVDPTEFIVSDGLTGIVGPNGCGKSNLVEALRWVMGESSYKSMRGSAMEDVIFSGSANRPPRNLGDVTVFLDNTSRTAPAAFNDADVLEVTRRIERDAGSAYKINGRDVRAKDVQLLFADASTGAHSSALVRQGQIGELINARPVARRAILEDAAGISGLHARRHEAELRLRAAEENLRRLDDIIAQLATQLQSLRRQARQARRYRRISTDIRTLEASLYAVRWRTTCQAIDEAQEKLNENSAELHEYTRVNSERIRSQATCAESLPPLRDAEAQCAAALQARKFALTELQSEEERLNARQGELTQTLQTAKRDQERNTQLLIDYRQTLKRLDSERAAIAQSLQQAAGLKDIYGDKLAAAERDLASHESALAELTTAMADSAARRAACERTISRLDAQLQRMDAESLAARAEQDRLDERLNDAQAYRAQQARVQDAADALADAEDAAIAAARMCAARREAESEKRDALTQAERRLDACETEARTLQSLAAAPDAMVEQPLIDNIEVKPGLETALAVAFGEALEAAFQPASGQNESDESYRKAPMFWVEPADAENDAPLPDGVTPFSTFVHAPAFLRRRLAQTGLVEQTSGVRLQRLLQPGQRLVSRQGDLWRWDGFTLRAGAATAAARRLAQRNRLDTLSRTIAPLRAEVMARREAYGKIQAERRQADQEQTQAQAGRRQRQSDLETARNALAAMERERSALKVRKGALEEASAHRAARRQEAERARDEAIADLADAAQAPDAAEKRDALYETVQAARRNCADQRARVDGLAQRIDAEQARAGAIAGERKQWERRLAGNETHIADLKGRMEQATAELERLSDIPAVIARKRGQLLSDLEALEQTHKQAIDAVVAAERELDEINRAARAAAETLANCREEKARLQERLEAERSQQTVLAQQIGETLDCNPQQVLEIAGFDGEGPMPDAADLARRLDKLKNERQRLGSVNLRAEEEAGEIGERHEALTGEHADLTGAIGKLRHGIASLNREGRTRLLDAFEQVDGHFRSLFRKLFHGGEARLELVSSDDPLEAGLEIIARPPGKRPQSLSLLSGGEQALTTLALIFAVFLTNPAPICVLDEVDAPLDDANVERFCTLMEDMAEKTDTRFVIITHHPITMARMHRLFGVTMAERGVSQLVSVDLQTAESYREAS